MRPPRRAGECAWTAIAVAGAATRFNEAPAQSGGMPALGGQLRLCPLASMRPPRRAGECGGRVDEGLSGHRLQ